MKSCGCYGRWFAGSCDCYECSECGASSDEPLETLDTKDDNRGPAYRPCAECAS